MELLGLAHGRRLHDADHRCTGCQHVRAHAHLIHYSEMARLRQLHHHHWDLLPHESLPQPSVTNDVSFVVVKGAG